MIPTIQWYDTAAVFYSLFHEMINNYVLFAINVPNPFEDNPALNKISKMEVILYFIKQRIHKPSVVIKNSFM